MDERFHKFPTTPHLFWLGDRAVRSEKALTPAEALEFLSHPVAVEEKIDGANLGVSFDETGAIRFQNRGNFLTGKLTGQWERLRAWASPREARLRELLRPGLILFGEWCYATHTIAYDRLPDWFLAFDVFDAARERFWSRACREKLVSAAGLAAVPLLGVGRYGKAELVAMLNAASAYADHPLEGIYLRIDQDDWLARRAKVVRGSFTQSISEHWSRQQMKRNELARDAACLERS